MSEIKMDEKAYAEFINWDIKALEKYMPTHSIEKKHIIEVLKWSIEQLYNQKLTDLPDA